MRCRDSIVLTDGNCGLTGDGTYLHGFTTAGEHIAIERIQANIPELENAGRLTFNSSVVPVRSEWEAEIIALLRAADCADEPPFTREDTMSYRPGPITGRVALEQLRDRLVEYLESDEYVDIATNGPRKAQPPWRFLQ
jgi:hypothetical protein